MRLQTERQKGYAAWLAGDQWKALRAAALERDGRACVECGAKLHLNVHHLKYRGKAEDTRLEDLRTLCRTCHRIEHHLWCLMPWDCALRRLRELMTCEKVTDADLIEAITICAEDDEATAEMRHELEFWYQWHHHQDLAESRASALAWMDKRVKIPELRLPFGDACEWARRKFLKRSVPLTPDQST